MVLILVKEMTKNDDFLWKTHRKNIDYWKRLSLNKEFLKHVRLLHAKWGLPILTDDVGDPIEKLFKAYDILYREKFSRLSFMLLQRDSSGVFSYLDDQRIEMLVGLQKSGDPQADMPKDIWEAFHGSQGRRKFKALDFTSPTDMELVAGHITLIVYQQVLKLLAVNFPPTFQVNETATIIRNDFFALYLSVGVCFFLQAQFVSDIDDLVRKSGLDRHWFHAFSYYVITGGNPVNARLVPFRNLIVRRNPKGNPIWEETSKTVNLDLLTARSQIRTPSTKKKGHNCPKPNQDRDLRIVELSEQKKDSLAKHKEIESKFWEEGGIRTEDHPEKLCESDDDISSQLFGLDIPDLDDARRRTDAIKQARSRIMKDIDQETYNSSL